MTAVLFALLFGFFLMRMPIAFGMGLSAAVAMYFFCDVSLTVAVQQMFSSNDSFPLLAVPFFMLAGSLMESGGISRRLADFANALAGFLHGGLAHVTVLASMFFAGISGSAAADTAAVGTLMIPEMKKRGYDPGFASAVQASAGSIGVIIPPSIPMVIYGVMASTSIGALFLGGILVGLLAGFSLMIVAYVIARKRGYEPDTQFSLAKILHTFKNSALGPRDAADSSRGNHNRCIHGHRERCCCHGLCAYCRFIRIQGAEAKESARGSLSKQESPAAL